MWHVIKKFRLFPDFSRFTKFPYNSKFSRFVGTLAGNYSDIVSTIYILLLNHSVEYAIPVYIQWSWNAAAAGIITFLGRIAHTMYVDAAFCYQPSSVVC